MQRHLHGQFLDPDRGAAHGRASERQIPDPGDTDAVPIHVPGDLNHGTVRQIRDRAVVPHVEVPRYIRPIPSASIIQLPCSSLRELELKTGASAFTQFGKSVLNQFRPSVHTRR